MDTPKNTEFTDHQAPVTLPPTNESIPFVREAPDPPSENTVHDPTRRERAERALANLAQPETPAGMASDADTQATHNSAQQTVRAEQLLARLSLNNGDTTPAPTSTSETSVTPESAQSVPGSGGDKPPVDPPGTTFANPADEPERNSRGIASYAHPEVLKTPEGKAIETATAERWGVPVESTEAGEEQYALNLTVRPVAIMSLASDGVDHEVHGLEVTGATLSDGSEARWASFYGKDDRSHYEGEETQVGIVLPKDMAGRLGMFAEEVLESPDYAAWAERHGDDDPYPYHEAGWNCHGISRHLAPDYQWALAPNAVNNPLPTALNLGEGVEPENLTPATPYYTGPLTEPEGHWTVDHSFVTAKQTDDEPDAAPTMTLSTFGGRQPLILMQVEEITRRFGAGIHPYLPKTHE